MLTGYGVGVSTEANTSAVVKRRWWLGDALWAVAVPICVMMFVLGMRMGPGGGRHEAGFAAATITACVVVLCLCWRGFEFLLWLRFPTSVQHTVAARVAAVVSVVGLVVQGVLLAVK